MIATFCNYATINKNILTTGKSKKHQTIEKKFVNLKMPKCISVNKVLLEAAFSDVFYEFHLLYSWT